MTPGTELDEAIGQALGRFADIPEGIDRFRAALFERHASAARLRFGLDGVTLPFASDPVAWYSLGFRPNESGRPSRTLAYARGEFFLQDAGSMLALAACDADDERTGSPLVCDLCS
ncbi:MAG: hypothetical protein AAFU85_32170, partial [Planctomycetota bacterium]